MHIGLTSSHFQCINSKDCNYSILRIICWLNYLLLITIIYRDKRREINVKDYMIENQSDSTLGRVPGQVNGQQFVIQNCKVCVIIRSWSEEQNLFLTWLIFWWSDIRVINIIEIGSNKNFFLWKSALHAMEIHVISFNISTMSCINLQSLMQC